MGEGSGQPDNTPRPDDKTVIGNDATVVDGGGGSPGVSIPREIGPYKVKRPIGAGGMGTVVLAQQESPRRDVAIKIMNPGVVSRKALRRFEFEAQTLGRLQHPAIDEERRADRVARPRRAQEHHEVRQFLDRAEAADRRVLVGDLLEGGVQQREVLPDEVGVEGVLVGRSRADPDGVADLGDALDLLDPGDVDDDAGRVGPLARLLIGVGVGPGRRLVAPGRRKRGGRSGVSLGGRPAKPRRL